MSESGFIEYADEEHFIIIKKYKSVVSEFVSIEAELSDWKSGVYQAVKYNTFSNSSYLAIYEEYLNRVNYDFLRVNGIGLIAVSSVSAKIIIKAKKRKPENIVSHHYLSELLVNSAFAI